MNSFKTSVDNLRSISDAAAPLTSDDNAELAYLMAGADVAMMCSALLHHGPQHLGTVLADLQRWMEEKEYTSVAQMKGSMSQAAVADPTSYERANYMKVLSSY